MISKIPINRNQNILIGKIPGDVCAVMYTNFGTGEIGGMAEILRTQAGYHVIAIQCCQYTQRQLARNVKSVRHSHKANSTLWPTTII